MVCAFVLCRLFPSPGKEASSEVFLEIVPEIRGLAAAFFSRQAAQLGRVGDEL
jgi:hypothetical protein